MTVRLQSWTPPLMAGVWFLTCLVPFTHLPMPVMDLGPVELPAHLGLFFFTGLFFLVAAVSAAQQRRSWPLFFTVGLIYVGAMALSSFFSDEPVRSIKFTLGVLLRGMAVGWAAYTLARWSDKDRWFSSLVLWLGLLLAVTSVFEMTAGRYPFFVRHGDPAEMANVNAHLKAGLPTGAMGEPLVLALLAVMLFPFALQKGLEGPLLHMAWLTPLIMTVVCTYRRTAYALLALIFFGALALFRVNRRRFLLLFALGAVAFGLFYITPKGRHQIRMRFKPSFTTTQLSEGHRVFTYQTSTAMLKTAPLLGIGPRMYEQRFSTFSQREGELPTPDNQFLRTLAETGVVGLASMLLLIGYPLVRFGRRACDGMAAFFLMNVAFLLSFVFVEGLSWPSTLVTYFVLTGWGLGRLDEQSGVA